MNIHSDRKRNTAANMGLCVSGHEVRTEKLYHLVNFIAGMQLVVSNAHQRKALSVSCHLENDLDRIHRTIKEQKFGQPRLDE